MSEFSHLIPSNLKELEVRKPSVQGSAYAAAEGRINFHSASARAIDTEADPFDIQLRQMITNNLQSTFFGQSDIGKSVANGVASIGLAAQRAIGMSDDDFVAYYGSGNYEYLPNGESAFANIMDPSLSENWTTEDKKELFLMKKRYETDEEYRKLVDMISPEKKEERLNKLRQQRDVSDQAVAEHFSQADGFFATANVFGQTVASYLVNDPVSAASIFLPAARFRQGTALATAGKFKLGFKQGAKDAAPFAATFPAIGAVEEARLLDLGASAAEAQSAYFDRLLEVPAAFGVRALASLAIDLTPAAGRVILGGGGKVINRLRKRQETPKTAEEPPTEPPTDPPPTDPENPAPKAPDFDETAKRTAARRKALSEIQVRLTNKKPFTPEEQGLVVENINTEIPLTADKISKADLFDENGVVKIDKFTKALGLNGNAYVVRKILESIYNFNIRNTYNDQIISGGEFSKIARGVDVENTVKTYRQIQSMVFQIENLQGKLDEGETVTRAETKELTTTMKGIADKKIIDKLNSGASLLDVMPELIAAANLARAINSGRAPKGAVSEAEYFPFDFDETKSKERLKQHVETRLPENAKRRGDKPQTDEEKTSVAEIDKQLKVVDENLFAERRAVEKDFSRDLNALNAEYQKKYDAIDETEVDKRVAVGKEWTAAANELRKKTDNKLSEVGNKYQDSINKMEAEKASLGGGIEQLSFWNQLRRIREKQVASREGEAKQMRANRKDFVARTGTPLEENIKKPEDVKIQQSEKAANEIEADSEIDKKFADGNKEDIETIQRQGLYRDVGEKIKKRALVADVHTKVERLNVGTDISPRSLIRIVFTDNHGNTTKTNIQINGDNEVGIHNDTVKIKRAAVDKFEPEAPKEGQPKSEHAGKPALRIDTINVEPGGEITFQQRYYLDEAAVREINNLQGTTQQGTAANVSHEFHRPTLRALSENWIMNDTTAFEGDNHLRRVRQNFELIHKCRKGR